MHAQCWALALRCAALTRVMPQVGQVSPVQLLCQCFELLLRGSQMLLCGRQKSGRIGQPCRQASRLGPLLGQLPLRKLELSLGGS